MPGYDRPSCMKGKTVSGILINYRQTPNPLATTCLVGNNIITPNIIGVFSLAQLHGAFAKQPFHFLFLYNPQSLLLTQAIELVIY